MCCKGVCLYTLLLWFQITLLTLHIFIDDILTIYKTRIQQFLFTKLRLRYTYVLSLMLYLNKDSLLQVRRVPGSVSCLQVQPLFLHNAQISNVIASLWAIFSYKIPCKVRQNKKKSDLGCYHIDKTTQDNQLAEKTKTKKKLKNEKT